MRNQLYGLVAIFTLLSSGLLLAHCGKCADDSCPDCSIFISHPGIEMKRSTPPKCTCKEGCSCKTMECSLCKKNKCACLDNKSVDETQDTVETIILGGGTKVHPGIKTYVIELSANPSTGYHWVIAEQNLPEGTKVTFGKIKYKKPVMPGASGILPVKIKRGEVGEGTLQLQYVSPSKKVEKTKEYIIKTIPGNV